MSEEIKLCPYCAEEIKSTAIVCKHCGRELPEFEEQIKGKFKERISNYKDHIINICKLFFRKYWWGIVLLLLVIITQTNIDYPPKISSITKELPQDLCEWFSDAYSLRVKKLSSFQSSRYIEWIQAINQNPLFTEDLIQELVNIFVPYKPFLDEFVDDWRQLGSHIEAEVFWQKELESSMMKIESIN